MAAMDATMLAGVDMAYSMSPQGLLLQINDITIRDLTAGE